MMKFTLTVKVNPNSSQRSFEWREDHLKVNLTSPPVNGEANEELLESLGTLFGLKSDDVILKSGRTSSTKQIVLKNLTRNRLTETLRSL